MKFVAGRAYHVYNRTNAGLVAFPQDRNYAFFFEKLEHHVAPHAAIRAWCLMPTHFHLLVIPGATADALNKQIGVMLRSYTRALQRQEDFHGSLFQQGTRAVPVDHYLRRCVRYIEMNPVKDGLVDHPLDWPYSSARRGPVIGSLPVIR